MKKTNISSIESKPLDEKFFECFITRAIKKECYIEVITLIHNTIEIYLQSLIIGYCTTKKDSLDYYLKRRHLFTKDSKIDSLSALNEICFLFDLINEEIYIQVKSFNHKRNVIIHRLLKAKGKKKKRETYQNIKKTARLGRGIQLKLSPLQHTNQDIKRIMYYFDNPDKIEKSHYDWIA